MVGFEGKDLEDEHIRVKLGQTFVKACMIKTIRNLGLSHGGLQSLMARVAGGNMAD